MTSRKCPGCRSTMVEAMKTEADGIGTARITFLCHDYRHTEVNGREVSA